MSDSRLREIISLRLVWTERFGEENYEIQSLNQYVFMCYGPKVFLYDGKTGDQVTEITGSPDGHTGGILSFSWSPDGKNILTCSGDATAKIWDVSAKSVVS